MKLTILGSGTSHGIPVMSCTCRVCASKDPHDTRMRASLYVKGNAGERVVIDTGPEFRLQAIRAGITHLDAVFLTHAHADHVHGLDDLRPLCYERPIPIYGSYDTLEELRERFSYVFKHTQKGGGKPRIIPRVTRKPVRIGALTFTPIPVQHGMLHILGWEIRETPGDTALYITDTNRISDTCFHLIHRPGILIIGGLRVRAHGTHFTFDEALSAAVKMKARKVFLTHICHEHSHQEIKKHCQTFRQGMPEISMEPAYDGLELEL
ncbi:MAG: MBL fold metallo-hydrolase [Treponema sp.]|nr:MBL fold metallo-hydrolase [Treponema sp.]